MPDPIDAPDIADDDILWRRVDARMLEANADGSESLQAWAYKDQNRELSVYLSRETTPQAVLSAGKPGQVLVGIRAGEVRKLGYKVVRDREAGNSAHCLVLPYPQKGADRKSMANASLRV